MTDIITQAKLTASYLTQAIAGTQQLRSTVTNVFSLLCDGVKPDEEEVKSEEVEPAGSLAKDSKKFLHKFQDYLQAVNQDYNEVEKYCNSMTTTLDLQQLGPSGTISLDSALDKSSLYRDAALTYQWNHRLHEYAQIASNVMHNHQVKRSQMQGGAMAHSRRRRPLPTKFNVLTTQHVDAILQTFANQLKDTSLKIVQSSGEIRVLQLTVGHVFVAIIVLRNLYLEKILVKGLDEDLCTQNGKIDLFSDSQFECMKKITDHAMSAILQHSTYQANQPEHALKYIIMWLQSYKTLFSDKCNVCGKHLDGGLPPLWREFRSPVTCHDSCRP